MSNAKSHLHHSQRFNGSYCLCASVIVLRNKNKAHETSESWNYTLLGYAPQFFGGFFGQDYTNRLITTLNYLS